MLKIGGRFLKYNLVVTKIGKLLQKAQEFSPKHFVCYYSAVSLCAAHCHSREGGNPLSAAGFPLSRE